MAVNPPSVYYTDLAYRVYKENNFQNQFSLLICILR